MLYKIIVHYYMDFYKFFNQFKLLILFALKEGYYNWPVVFQCLNKNFILKAIQVGRLIIWVTLNINYQKFSTNYHKFLSLARFFANMRSKKISRPKVLRIKARFFFLLKYCIIRKCLKREVYFIVVKSGNFCLRVCH